MSAVQDKLFSLLGEIVAACERVSIDYVAVDYLAWCALKSTEPVGVLEYAIAVGADDIANLRRELCALSGSERIVDETPAGGLKYIDAHTMLIDLNGPVPSHPGLAVCVKAVLPTDQGFEYSFDEKTVFELSKDPRKHVGKAVLGGVELLVPPSQGDFYDVVFGERPGSKYPLKATSESYSVLADAEVPFSTFLDVVGREKVDDLVSEGLEFCAWKSRELGPANKQVSSYYPMLAADTQRFRLCEKYMPLKEALLKGWRKGAKLMVSSQMADYLKSVKNLYKHGTTIYFDEELFQLAVELLREQKWPHADEIEQLVPPRHREIPLGEKIASYVL